MMYRSPSFEILKPNGLPQRRSSYGISVFKNALVDFKFLYHIEH